MNALMREVERMKQGLRVIIETDSQSREDAYAMVYLADLMRYRLDGYLEAIRSTVERGAEKPLELGNLTEGLEDPRALTDASGEIADQAKELAELIRRVKEKLGHPLHSHSMPDSESHGC